MFVRESDIERHRQTEYTLICESFAMDHQTYVRYGAFQHVNLQSLRKENKKQFNELKGKRFGASLTGDVFSTIHGDLVTELFNKETKGQRASLVPSAVVLVSILTQ